MGPVFIVFFVFRVNFLSSRHLFNFKRICCHGRNIGHIYSRHPVLAISIKCPVGSVNIKICSNSTYLLYIQTIRTFIAGNQMPVSLSARCSQALTKASERDVFRLGTSASPSQKNPMAFLQCGLNQKQIFMYLTAAGPFGSFTRFHDSSLLHYIIFHKSCNSYNFSPGAKLPSIIFKLNATKCCINPD